MTPITDRLRELAEKWRKRGAGEDHIGAHYYTICADDLSALVAALTPTLKADAAMLAETREMLDRVKAGNGPHRDVLVLWLEPLLVRLEQKFGTATKHFVGGQETA